MKKGNFQQLIVRIDRMLATAKESSETVKILCEKGDMIEANEEAFRLEGITEKVVLMTRALPAYTGYPRARSEVNHIIADAVPIDIGYTESGWFSVRIPLLLPKKEHGSSDYIRQILYPAMQRFFRGRIPQRSWKSDGYPPSHRSGQRERSTCSVHRKPDSPFRL